MDAEKRAREAWSNLVEGRSAVVHRFDAERRLFLVVEPSTDARPLRSLACAILTQVCGGCSNKQIAYELGISESTVSAHVRAAVARLGAASLADLVRWPWAV